MPVSTPVMRIFQQCGFDDIQEQQWLTEFDCPRERCMIEQTQVALEPDNVHDASRAVARSGLTRGSPLSGS